MKEINKIMKEIEEIEVERNNLYTSTIVISAMILIAMVIMTIAGSEIGYIMIGLAAEIGLIVSSLLEDCELVDEKTYLKEELKRM